MNARTKFAWVDIPRQSLRQGLACGDGGVRIMLLMGEERGCAAPPSGTAPYADPQPDARAADKSH